MWILGTEFRLSTLAVNQGLSLLRHLVGPRSFFWDHPVSLMQKLLSQNAFEWNIGAYHELALEFQMCTFPENLLCIYSLLLLLKGDRARRP